MDSKIIVVTEDRDDSAGRNVAVLDSKDEAERLVETLLQAGTGQERIRVFTGAEMDVEITQRPVVMLLEKDGHRHTVGDPLHADGKNEGQEATDEAGAVAAE